MLKKIILFVLLTIGGGYVGLISSFIVMFFIESSKGGGDSVLGLAGVFIIIPMVIIGAIIGFIISFKITSNKKIRF